MGMWVFLGDFNDVRRPEKRLNSEFVSLNAHYFNNFIEEADFQEYQMGGRQYTYRSDNGKKLSKLDRFLIPCRIFNSWFEIPGATEYVQQLMESFHFEGPADLALDVKLKWAKKRLKDWVQEELEDRAECRVFISEVNKIKAMFIKQKSRVRWEKEGDENMKYFHGVMNANTSNNRIHGLHIDGAWETSPPLVKDYVFSFFAEKFKEPIASRPNLECPFLPTVSPEDAESLVIPFTISEIKCAVWDCEGDRVPGRMG
ncbi:uncharacterized protein LOC110887046 [Helianthus annuus]|uniref:uncharacterized protein LOC110887046 n=1 Tax=Helianthus annuus TaxID=4232 RepID=UPI000B900597|nr:uncharacterized protein LOC110887046 [Helianthus annuus]